jgi:Pyruvate/2-oxoacid:ferredoxin oxidoreductase gamma subunit
MIFLLQTTISNANESLMVKDGKIYLVLTIASIIMIGLFAYITSVDRKLTQLEKNIKG